MTKIDIPESGNKILLNQDGTLKVPDNPIIPFIEGDGIGSDIWKSSVRVFDSAIKKAYNNQRKIQSGRNNSNTNYGISNDFTTNSANVSISISGNTGNNGQDYSSWSFRKSKGFFDCVTYF